MEMSKRILVNCLSIDRAFYVTGWWKERERRGENGDRGRRERKTGQREIREGERTRS